MAKITVSRKAATCSNSRNVRTVVLLAAACVAAGHLTSPAAQAAQISLSWVAPTTNSDGTAIIDLAGYKLYSGNASGSYQQSVDVGNLTTYSLGNLSAGSTYYFAVTAYDTAKKESSYSNQVSETFPAQATVPGAPTAVSAVSGNAQATVTFTAPATGGSAITGYTVTSNPGNVTVSGSASPITVTGLTNGTAYTFTVVATDATGASAASSPSTSVTPVASGSIDLTSITMPLLGD